MFKIVKPNKRNGFSLIESVMCALILSIVVLGVLSSANYIKQSQASARNRTYMSLHQLNVMEELKQISLDEKLLAFYEESKFSSSEFKTIVRVEESSLGDFTVYRVEIESESKNNGDLLNNVFTLTDIGALEKEESLDG